LHRAVDAVAWVFPFFGTLLVLRGGNVLLITAGCVAGCMFVRMAGDLQTRIQAQRKIRAVDHDLISRMRALDERDD